MQVEVFFIYHNGEQRGPYTVKQVNHLHRCGFIDDDTLYWREGLEQWQPVSQIVLRRRRRNRFLLWSVTAGAAVAIAVFASLFGPVTADAWRELTSGDFTEESAWWRARGLVRDRLHKGEAIQFDPFSSAEARLHDHDRATVVLSGTLTLHGGSSERAAWRVLLRHDPDRAVSASGRCRRRSPASSQPSAGLPPGTGRDHACQHDRDPL
jgi:hypothetical protein